MPKSPTSCVWSGQQDIAKGTLLGANLPEFEPLLVTHAYSSGKSFAAPTLLRLYHSHDMAKRQDRYSRCLSTRPTCDFLTNVCKVLMRMVYCAEYKEVATHFDIYFKIAYSRDKPVLCFEMLFEEVF